MAKSSSSLGLNEFSSRSGQSIFTRPRPIDLSAARRAGYNSLDLDLEAEYDEEEGDPELSLPLAQNPVLFDAQDAARPPTEDVPFKDIPRSANQVAREQDEEDVWADI